MFNVLFDVLFNVLFICIQVALSDINVQIFYFIKKLTMICM